MDSLSQRESRPQGLHQYDAPNEATREEIDWKNPFGVPAEPSAEVIAAMARGPAGGPVDGFDDLGGWVLRKLRWK
jgi:hypothetical protein